jgi:hypothetical protein
MHRRSPECRWVEAILRDEQHVRTRFAKERPPFVCIKMYQYVNRFLLQPPFFCRKAGFFSAPV